MRKFVIFLVIAAGAFFLYVSQLPNDSGDPEQVLPDVSGRNYPADGSFVVDGDLIKFNQGLAEKEDEGGFREVFFILDEMGVGDLNADGKTDTALFINRIAGASGVFIYASAYVSGPIGYKGVNAIFLGDRIRPQKIEIEKGGVTVKYLDRAGDEPFAAEPTVPKTLELIYQNGEILER